MTGEGWFSNLRRIAVLSLTLGALAALSGCAGGVRGGGSVAWQQHFKSIHRGAILISLDQRRLSYWGPGGKSYREFRIAVPAQDYLERTGRTSVVRRRANPDWRPTPDMRKRMPGLPSYIGPGPHNPLGEHALYLGWRYYAIHGTNNPRSIGTRATSGCFRLHPRDIAWLFDRVQLGTPVKVVHSVRAYADRSNPKWRDETEREFTYHAQRAAKVDVEIAARKKSKATSPVKSIAAPKAPETIVASDAPPAAQQTPPVLVTVGADQPVAPRIAVDAPLLDAAPTAVDEALDDEASLNKSGVQEAGFSVASVAQ